MRIESPSKIFKQIKCSIAVSQSPWIVGNHQTLVIAALTAFCNLELIFSPEELSPAFGLRTVVLSCTTLLNRIIWPTCHSGGGAVPWEWFCSVNCAPARMRFSFLLGRMACLSLTTTNYHKSRRMWWHDTLKRKKSG